MKNEVNIEETQVSGKKKRVARKKPVAKQPVVEKLDEPVVEKTEPEAVVEKLDEPVVEKTEPEAVVEKTEPKRQTAGENWWTLNAPEFHRKGYGQRNIVHKAARFAGKSFDEANVACAMKGTLEQKVLSLF